MLNPLLNRAIIKIKKSIISFTTTVIMKRVWIRLIDLDRARKQMILTQMISMEITIVDMMNIIYFELAILKKENN